MDLLAKSAMLVVADHGWSNEFRRLEALKAVACISFLETRWRESECHIWMFALEELIMRDKNIAAAIRRSAA